MANKLSLLLVLLLAMRSGGASSLSQSPALYFEVPRPHMWSIVGPTMAYVLLQVTVVVVLVFRSRRQESFATTLGVQFKHKVGKDEYDDVATVKRSLGSPGYANVKEYVDVAAPDLYYVLEPEKNNVYDVIEEDNKESHIYDELKPKESHIYDEFKPKESPIYDCMT